MAAGNLQPLTRNGNAVPPGRAGGALSGAAPEFGNDHGLEETDGGTGRGLRRHGAPSGAPGPPETLDGGAGTAAPRS